MQDLSGFRGSVPIEVRYRGGLLDTAGNEAHAATFIDKRLIVLDTALLADAAEHERILTHEIFHFVWIRLGNPLRLGWEQLLRAEWTGRARGEAGWSAQWRKKLLTNADVVSRTRHWREYCCEAFCDSAARLYAGPNSEDTLAARHLRKRQQWFRERLPRVPHI